MTPQTIASPYHSPTLSPRNQSSLPSSPLPNEEEIYLMGPSNFSSENSIFGEKKEFFIEEKIRNQSERSNLLKAINEDVHTMQIYDQGATDMRTPESTSSKISNLSFKPKENCVENILEWFNFLKVNNWLTAFNLEEDSFNSNFKLNLDTMNTLNKVEKSCLYFCMQGFDRSALEFSQMIEEFTDTPKRPLVPGKAKSKEIIFCENVLLQIKEIRKNYLKEMRNYFDSSTGVSQAEFQSSHTEKTMSQKILVLTKRIIFVSAVMSGIFLAGIFSFMGFTQILPLIFIQSISQVWLFVISLCLASIECKMFFSFEVGMLKSAMGFDGRSFIKKCLDFDKEFIDLIQSIQIRIDNKSQLQTESLHDLHTLQVLRNLLNDSVKNLKMAYKNNLNPETKTSKYYKRFVTFVGAFTLSATVYFGIISLLRFFSPSLVGSPVGWIITLFMLSANLAYYVSMRGRASLGLFKAEHVEYPAFMEKIAMFPLYERSVLNQYSGPQMIT